METVALSVTEHPLSFLAALYEESGIEPDALDYYATAVWFQTLAANCLQIGESTTVLCAGGVVLPLRLGPVRLGPLAGRQAGGLSNFYSCRFCPPGLEQAAEPVAAMAALGTALRERGFAALRFDALDVAPHLAMAEGLRRAGWVVEPFRQFGNWFLATDGLDFERYWRARPGALRNTGRRRFRSLVEKGEARIVCYTRPDEAEAAIAAYEAVYAGSWQPTEPFPGYMPGLIRAGFADGEAQVWCLFVAGQPVAAQVWTRRHGQATIFKLAYLQDWGRQSAGTVLTMAAIQAALADPGIREIDFGWGDDAYKREWLPERRQRYGIAAYNPRRLTGLALAVRNLGPQTVRKILGPLRHNPSRHNPAIR